jgi:two-component system LytT family response regulator
VTRIRAVVVDDEPTAREAVLSLVAEHPAVEVVGEASNGAEAVRVVRALRPDLLFLDVQMPDLDGFGVLDALGGDIPRGVVFVTAHDEHAIRAFDVHALDYLVKPFGRPRFAAAVERAVERLRAMEALTLQRTVASVAADRAADRAAGADGPGELAIEGATEDPVEGDAEGEGSHASRPAVRRIGVRNGARTVLVEIEAIDWVEAFGDCARIHVGARTHVIARRMQALDALLEARGFVRIHRSLIVNTARVRELHRESDGGGVLVLHDGVRLRVSRARWEAVERALAMEAG